MPTTYILGAGSSRYAKAPLFSDFKEHAERLQVADRFGTIPAGFGGPLARNRIERALRLWNATAPAANVEDFYIHAEVRAATGYGVNPAELLDDVQYLIAKTLDFSTAGADPDVHLQWIEAERKRVTPEGGVPRLPLPMDPNGACIISLNWDILVDNALSMTTGLDWSYAIPGIGPIEDTPPNPPGDVGVNLLKLHGSLNWWTCGACAKLWYTHKRKGALDYWERGAPPCRSCGEASLAPLFVPPTSQKLRPGGIHALAELWLRARLELAICEELVIIGYSFPTTDVQFKMFLLDALADNADLDRILVVTNPQYGTARQQFEDRYSQVFDGTRHLGRLRFVYSGFEDWVRTECSRRQ